MRVRHREAFRSEKHAHGERGGGDQQTTKHGGGQHREFLLRIPVLGMAA
jgi:hypothetical protein